MNNKKVSALVLAGLISAQTLVPAIVTFADEVEKINVGNEQVKNQQEEIKDTEKIQKGDTIINENKEEVDELAIKEVDSENDEYVEIPDHYLRLALNKALGYGPYNKLTKEQLKNVSELDLNRENITNLTGIENCVNLRTLNLESNQLWDISPLSKLKNLEVLKLSGNTHIKNIEELSNIKSLTRLEIENMKITDISMLKNLTNINYLKASKNQISDISALENLREITHLYMSDNQISDISILSNLQKLKTVYFDNNQINDISVVAKLTDTLEYFYAKANKISNVSMINTSEFKNLKIIQLSYQDLRGVDLRTSKESVSVKNMVTVCEGGNFKINNTSEYSYDKEKELVTFLNVYESGDRSYNFVYNKNNIIIFNGDVKHKIIKTEVVDEVTAEIDQSNGGVMLSKDGLGLRIFTSLNNINPDQVATYYITTASKEEEEPIFEVKSTVLNGNYSQIKTNINIEALDKLVEGVKTKLYVKRVIEGEEPTYIELKSSSDYLANSFNINVVDTSDNKSIDIEVSKNNENVVQLNKSNVSSDSFNQGVFNIYWNSTGMVVEGRPTNNGSSDDFNNAKVSMMFKDENKEYLNVEGTNEKIEVKGMYINGKYKVIIPYKTLEKAKYFELRIIGENVQFTNELTKGTVENFTVGIKDNKVYKLIEENNIVELKIEELGKITSNLSSVQVTTNNITNKKQFSIKGSIGGVKDLNTSVKYTIVAKKEEEILFEQVATKTGDNQFKANLSLTNLINKLEVDEKVVLKVKIEYLGEIIETDLDLNQAAVSVKDKESNQTFEMNSENGKAVIIRK